MGFKTDSTFCIPARFRHRYFGYTTFRIRIIDFLSVKALFYEILEVLCWVQYIITLTDWCLKHPVTRALFLVQHERGLVRLDLRAEKLQHRQLQKLHFIYILFAACGSLYFGVDDVLGFIEEATVMKVFIGWLLFSDELGDRYGWTWCLRPPSTVHALLWGLPLYIRFNFYEWHLSRKLITLNLPSQLLNRVSNQMFHKKKDHNRYNYDNRSEDPHKRNVESLHIWLNDLLFKN